MFACAGTDRADAGDVAFDVEIAVPDSGASDIPFDSDAGVIPDVQSEVDARDVGQDDPGGPSDILDVCEDYILIDSPCAYPYECLGPAIYGEWYTYWCDVPCCSGGECRYKGTNNCPEGTLCYSNPSWGGSDEIPCRGNECNESEGRLCEPGHFCDTPPGACGGPGVCLLRPADGVYSSQLSVLYGDELKWDSSCGCDGVTYKGWVERQRAGTSVKFQGPCCDPDLIGLSQANEDDFGMFVICAEPGINSLMDSMPDELAAVFSQTTFGPDGSQVGCDAGDVSFVGTLVTGQDGTIDAGMFDILCRLAGSPGIRGVSGRPAGFCGQVELPPPIGCLQQCPSSCGCSLCESGKTRCRPDGRAIEVCTESGCWNNKQACVPTANCVEDDQGQSCQPS